MSGSTGSRKGQFFMVSAIMIVIILHMLASTLLKSTSVDVSSVQDNGPAWMIDETEKGLYEIARSDLDGTDGIDEYMRMQKEIAKESGYSLGFFLGFSPQADGVFSVYSISLESSDFYIMRDNRTLPYYSLCDDGAVCVPANPGYSESCCGAYGLCC